MSRIYAIVPAAGLSRRMGEPKLLLPTAGGTVIDAVLDALDIPQIAATAVVIRDDNAELANHLATRNVDVVIPNPPPPEMRESVTAGVRAVQEKFNPAADDAWLVVPADFATLTKKVVVHLCHHWQNSSSEILVPRRGAHRGHPTLFRWALTAELDLIPADQGLNWLVARHENQIAEVEVAHGSVLLDVDTPEDYQKLRDQRA